MKVTVYVRLKSAVLDPQGKAITQTLHRMGYSRVADVRVGKLIELELEAITLEQAKNEVEQMTRKLLCNPVIEDVHYEFA